MIGEGRITIGDLLLVMIVFMILGVFVGVIVASNDWHFYRAIATSEDGCLCEACNMRFGENDSRGILGLYSHEGYFCVWTRDREPYDIAETTFHELAHYYAHTQEEHFCEEGG